MQYNERDADGGEMHIMSSISIERRKTHRAGRYECVRELVKQRWRIDMQSRDFYSTERHEQSGEKILRLEKRNATTLCVPQTGWKRNKRGVPNSASESERFPPPDGSVGKAKMAAG